MSVRQRQRQWTFAGLGVVLAFLCVWVTLPFLGEILWSLVAAIVFLPLHDAILLRTGRRSLAASLTVVVILLALLIPLAVTAVICVEQASSIIRRVSTGEIDLAEYYAQFLHALPTGMRGFLVRNGLSDIGMVQGRLSSALGDPFSFAVTNLQLLGERALAFFLSLTVMVYLTFFFVRDGRGMSRRLAVAIPMVGEDRAVLVTTFVQVVRATIKGSVAVAVVQGAIGGLVLWLIGMEDAVVLGAVMAVASFLPAVGTGLVWVPIAVFLLATGAVWQGCVLIFCGLFVIGLVDNILRPLLIGSETRMPDFIVLVSTLGGLESFGFDGLIAGPLVVALFIAFWKTAVVRRRPGDRLSHERAEGLVGQGRAKIDSG